MQRYFIRVNAFGIVDNDLEIDGESSPPVGMIDVTGHPQWGGLGSLTTMAYDTGTNQFTPVIVPRREISLELFLDRITVAEHTAFETLMATHAQARAWWGQLIARRTVHLDAPRLVQGLLFVKSLGIPAVWPDEATADARITAIRADG